MSSKLSSALKPSAVARGVANLPGQDFTIREMVESGSHRMRRDTDCPPILSSAAIISCTDTVNPGMLIAREAPSAAASNA